MRIRAALLSVTPLFSREQPDVTQVCLPHDDSMTSMTVRICIYIIVRQLSVDHHITLVFTHEDPSSHCLVSEERSRKLIGRPSPRGFVVLPILHLSFIILSLFSPMLRGGHLPASEGAMRPLNLRRC